jgi:hypothetical protein
MSECLKHVQTDVILCYTVLDPDLFVEYSIKRERDREIMLYIYMCVCILESRSFLQVLEGEVRPTKPY